MYQLDFRNGLTEEFYGTLNKAMSAADDMIQELPDGAQLDDFTEDDYLHCDGAYREWYGEEYDENIYDCDDPIRFGSFGFYTDWILTSECPNIKNPEYIK